MFDESGGTEQQRREESRRLLERLKDKNLDSLSPKESEFIGKIRYRLQVYGDNAYINVKQLFWLRDITERFL